MLHEPAQLHGVEACGRAAADIEGLDGKAAGVGHFAGGGKLTAQAGDIGFDLGAGGLVPHRAGDKAAITAPRRAERDAGVNAAVHRLRGGQDRGLAVGDGFGRCEALRRAVVGLQEPGFDLRLRGAFGPHIVDDPHRAHAGHHAPGRADAGFGAEQAVEQFAERKFAVLARGIAVDRLWSTAATTSADGSSSGKSVPARLAPGKKMRATCSAS